MDIKEVNWSADLDGDKFTLNVKGNEIAGCHWHDPGTTPDFILLFLHGLCSNIEFNANFLRVFPSLKGASLATDHKGNGFSPGDDSTIEDICDEAEELIKYARSLYPKNTPMFLMGHSMGGLTSIYLTMKKKDDFDFLNEINGVIAHSPWISTNPERLSYYQKVGVKIAAWIVPNHQINSGMNLDNSPYSNDFKEAAKGTGHFKSEMTLKLFYSVLNAYEFVQANQDEWPKGLNDNDENNKGNENNEKFNEGRKEWKGMPLLIQQGDQDNCVDVEVNYKWGEDMERRNKGLVILKKYKDGNHDLYKDKSRKCAFEDLMQFINKCIK